MPKLLFVCHANIARSAAAEVLAQSQLGDASAWTVESAGVRALVGEDIDEVIAGALRERGLVPQQHEAQQVTNSMLDSADLVLAFESAHRMWMLRESPKSVRKTFTVRGAAAILDGIPRRAAPLAYLSNVKTSGKDEDFADPYGRGPDVARQAIQEIDLLLSRILPGIDALPRVARSSPQAIRD
ncbi:hypothetical protein [Pseudoclavibacter sp. JSM 162008]|uniref:arsenate reductase/protein-tyrosine-phosphatase family protein n=1 Tax=Pseudoclavibacter sp. JSM 162008 TaxID=3229855 RepID=UPI003523481F